MRFEFRPAGMLLALAFAGGVHAQGNITFGHAPAVSYDGKAPGERAGKAGNGGASVQQPGNSRAIMAPVSPEQSEQAIWARTPARINQGVAPAPQRPKSAGTVSGLRIGGDGAPAAPASIAELARALRGNPDLIYEYVRNNIEYVPTWGTLKGEFGTLLDNQGSAFDQAALMVALLRQSGHTASVVKGRINLSAAQVRDWMGVDTSNVCAVLNLLAAGQIPTSAVEASAAGACPGSTAALHSLKLDHVWVKVNIGGTNYVFDPSYKPHTHKAGIDLAAATGYNAATYMSAATAGATITADYVQGINRTSVRNNLATYASNLASYLRTNLPAGALDDAIGGMTIMRLIGVSLRQTALPYQDTTVALTEWSSDIPANYKPTMRVQYQGIDRTFSSDAIYGRRLSITYNASNQPVLSLDGAVLATGTATTPGTYGTVSFVVSHGAYAQTSANQSFTQQIKAGGTFLIGNGWGPGGRGPVDLHRTRLDQAMASGAAAGSETVLGSTLAVLSSSWIGQVNQSGYITDRLARTNTLYHHQVGIAGYNTAAYVDLPGNMLSVVSQAGNAATEAAVFFSSTMHSSIFESTAVQQTTGGSAVSTVKLIDQAVAGNDKIFDARSANFASAVQPNLVGCAGSMAGFQSALAAGSRLILPARCNLSEGAWTGAGYYSILVSGGVSNLGAIIGGGLAGGFSSSPLPVVPTTYNTLSYTASPSRLTAATGSSFGDPIDMTKGHFLYGHDDIESGAGEFPMSLGFSRAYTSASSTQSGPLGLGWTSNLLSSATVGSDGFQGMGEDSALDAVHAIAEKLVSLDLMTDAAKPVRNMVIATLGQRWFGEQIVNNTVIVKQGMNGEVFVKLPGGQYNSPPGNPVKLTRNADNTFKYETLHRAAVNFNAAGNVASYVHPAGVEVRYTYTGNFLTQVSNSLGRTLTLTNASGRIGSVTDGVNTVNYVYDGSGNLVTFKNALTQATTYQYDRPGRMTKIFYPSNPTIAFATNVYDTLGRVQTQTNASGKLYTYYFAGSRSEEVGPLGKSLVSYLDANGRVLKAIDPLGYASYNFYDGQNRLVRSYMPEGNSTEFVYDDAPCAAQLRCTHNVKTLRKWPKLTSTLPPLTSSFVYESAFNKLASATDPMLKTTNYTYTAQGNPLTVAAPADAQGVQPVTTYGYTSFTPSGFPSFYLQTSVTNKISATSSVVTSTSYNASNKYVQQSLVKDVGGLNLTASYTYDAVGNLTRVDGPRSDVVDKVDMAYDAQRRLTQLTDALGKVVKNAYDADGRLVRTATQIGPQWLVSCSSYTPTGKLLKAWGPSQMASDTTCPAAAAPVSVVDYLYDELDRLGRTTEQLPAAEGGNRVSDTAYYLNDAVKGVINGVGSPVAQVTSLYIYTPNGLMARTADAKGNVTTYQYDGFDRKSKTHFPDTVTAGTSSATDVEQYGYDGNGNLTTLIKRDGQTITTSYDNLGRVLGRSSPSAADNVGFAYDLLSRQTLAHSADGFDVSFTYDNAGRMTGTTAGGKTLSYLYDPAGNRIRTTWPEATPFYVTATFDALNRPLAIAEMGTANLASYAYDDMSRRTMVTLGNGTTTSYGYSAQGAAASLSHNLGGTAQDNSWTYNRNQAQEITTHSWSNDIYQWTGYTNGTRSYGSNALNQLTTAAGAAIAHDVNGNLTGDGVWTYAYDIDNRLKSATKAGLTAGMTYDALGRLRRMAVGANTTALLYSDKQLVAEYDGAGTLQRRYVHGHGSDEPLVWYEGATIGSKSWLYADHLGSVVATANSAGVSTATYTYGPFGEPGSGAGAVRFRYTGQQYFADLGLSYYKARFYSPTLGRFLQTDPIGYTDSMNLYGYAGNNPLNNKDPSGLVLDTVLDVGFILYDVGVLIHDGVTNGGRNWKTNTVALGADVAGLAIPFATGGGQAYRAGNKLVDVAKQADGLVPAGGTAQRRGIAVHKEFDTIINNGGAGRKITSETSYVGGRHNGDYRPKGSSNPDAVLGNLDTPTAIYDLKSGASGITNKQMSAYERNLPGGTPVYTIRPSGHDVPRPTTYSGFGAAGNLLFGGSNNGGK